MSALETRRHRPAVVRFLADEQVQYQARCTCGHRGRAHGGRPPALADQEAHVCEVAPPEHLRCREPKNHGARWWDACPLCQHQEVLFDL